MGAVNRRLAMRARDGGKPEALAMTRERPTPTGRMPIDVWSLSLSFTHFDRPLSNFSPSSEALRQDDSATARGRYGCERGAARPSPARKDIFGPLTKGDRLPRRLRPE